MRWLKKKICNWLNAIVLKEMNDRKAAITELKLTPATLVSWLGAVEAWGLAAEILKVREVCDEFGLTLHLDGARLYLAPAYSGVSVREYAALFDTVYVSMYKYFGAASGAILAGDYERAAAEMESSLWARQVGKRATDLAAMMRTP